MRSMPASPPPALISTRSLTVFVAIALLWIAAAWIAFDRQVRERTAASISVQKEDLDKSVVTISANVDRVFNRLQGLAAVLAGVTDVRTALAPFGPDVAQSPLPYDARKAEWTRRPELLALSRQMRAAAEDIGVDIIWAMNASGDCVVASNHAEPTSFIGTNYADRAYFTTARSGGRGRQFAVGRVTKVPGLFFSAPVMADGRFVGAVTVKNDLPRISSALNDPHAFVTDEHGVIILAADRSLEMRALPGATVHKLPDATRLSRYMRLKFDTYQVDMAGESG